MLVYSGVLSPPGTRGVGVAIEGTLGEPGDRSVCGRRGVRTGIVLEDVLEEVDGGI